MRHKKLTLAFLAIILLFTISCNSELKKTIRSTKSAHKEACNGVQTAAWQNEAIGLDAEKTAKFVADVTAAAKADAKKSEELKGSAAVDANIKSDLAKVINQNVTQSSSLTQEFWEQEINMVRCMCVYMSLLERKDINKETKLIIINDIRDLNKASADFALNKAQKKSRS